MSSSNILSLIGLCHKAGKLEIGEEPVGGAARSRQARLVLVASDAAENSRRRAQHFAEAGAAPWLGLPFTKAELGRVLGRTSCAMAAITDAGFAAALATKLAALDAEQYGETAGMLDVRAKRVQDRQADKRRHEKNLREGKKKPWAPTAPKAAPAAKAARLPQRPAALAQGTAPAAPAPKPRLAPRGRITITKK